jgi:glycerophosphoryl diester phosphodiesterase
MTAVYASLDSAKSEGIEIDIRVSNDDEIVLMHDTTLDRTTDCTGQTSSRNFYGYMDACDAGSWKGVQFTGERIPLLSNITDSIYPSRMDQFVVLDLKDFPLATFRDIAAWLSSEYGTALYDHLIFGCWTYQCVDQAVIDLAPYYQMFITSVPLNIDEAASRGVDIISLSFGSSTANYVSQAQAAGIDVHVWTVNGYNDIERALSYKVNGIITDYPERVIEVRDGRK